jgi:hypothetical protein
MARYKRKWGKTCQFKVYKSVSAISLIVKTSGTGNCNLLTMEKICFTGSISTNCTRKKKKSKPDTVDVTKKYNQDALI